MFFRYEMDKHNHVPGRYNMYKHHWVHYIAGILPEWVGSNEASTLILMKRARKKNKP